MMAKLRISAGAVMARLVASTTPGAKGARRCRQGSVREASTAVIEPAFGKSAQGVVDLPVDLDAVARQSCACPVAMLARNADFRDTRLARRSLDQVDPPADFA